MNSGKIRYFDILTKEEMNETDIKNGIPFLVMKENWEVRIWKRNEFGEVEEQFLSPENARMAKQEIIIQQLKAKGMTDIDVKYQDKLQIDPDIGINIDNFVTQYIDPEGNKKKQFIDANNMKNLVFSDGNRTVVNISDRVITSGSIINFNNLFNNRGDGSTNFRGLSSSAPVTLNINQFGFERSYNLRDAEDFKRLREDLKIMPKNKEEAMRNNGEPEQHEVRQERSLNPND